MKFKTTSSVVIRILLWAVMLIGGVVGGIYCDLVCFESYRKLFLNPLYHLLTFVAGYLLMTRAFRAAAAGGKELARHGKEGDVPRLETNRLVTSGIYAHMRHPMLFGLMLVPLALGLMVGSPTFITIIAPVEMLFIVVMILTLEERECRKKFGSDYDAYARKVPAVCLSPHCLRLLFSRKREER
ncbi:isoprenylcysteine carboxylmethyltransferase family protein [Hydrogenimonas sp. SS33]|uniref:methyltransferase family protein n=1 Tax=Hydrogenimonas leucolamina TaxID=2954236 RepID=UPI00336BCFB6